MKSCKAFVKLFSRVHNADCIFQGASIRTEKEFRRGYYHSGRFTEQQNNRTASVSRGYRYSGRFTEQRNNIRGGYLGCWKSTIRAVGSDVSQVGYKRMLISYVTIQVQFETSGTLEEGKY